MRKRKLVIAAESLGGAEAALAFCSAVLDWTPAKPTGLIIEPDDSNLWTNSGQIVSATGAVLTIPPFERLRRVAKSDAKALDARLASLAIAYDTEWTCEAIDGELVTQACASIADDDILLLGQRPITPRPGKVLLLEPNDEPSEASIGLAGALAQASATSISLMRQQEGSDKDDLVARVDQSYVGAVVVDLDAGPIHGESDLRRLFAAARCPVAVLGASRLRRRKTEETLE